MTPSDGTTRLLVIDDELTEVSEPVTALRKQGAEVTVLRREDKRVPPVEEVLSSIEEYLPHAILCDLEFSGEPLLLDREARNGLDLARELHQIRPAIPIVLYTSYIGEAIRKTVEDPTSDFIVHAVSKRDAVANPKHALRELLDVIRLSDRPTTAELVLTISHSGDEARRHFPHMLRTRATSPKVRRFFRRILELAERGEPILITGDPGVGKELFARALHFSGPRLNLPFVAVEAGLTQNRDELRSWFYGRLPGEFTDVAGRVSQVRQAGAGTVLLNDLFAAPMDCQNILLPLFESKPVDLVVREHGKLLRRRVEPSCRVIATVNPIDKPYSRASLEEWRLRGVRKDLFDRLTVLEVPGWEERKEDIPDAIQANFQAEFLHRFPSQSVPELFHDTEFQHELEQMIAEDLTLLNGRAFQRIGHSLAAGLKSASQTVLLRDVREAILSERARTERVPVRSSPVPQTSGVTAVLNPRGSADAEAPLETFLRQVEEVRRSLSEVTDRITAKNLAAALADQGSGAFPGRVLQTRPDMFFPAHLWKLSEFDDKMLPRDKSARIEALCRARMLYPRSLYSRWIERAIQLGGHGKKPSKRNMPKFPGGSP